MSTEEVTAADAAAGPPLDQHALQEEIERTREHLGETVEALVAKADVQAQAREKARQLTELLKSTAAQGRQRAVTAATSISKAAPEPVKEAAANAGAATRRNRGPLTAAVGAAVASVLAWLLVRRWRGRS
jgi:regulator of sirC expression with transglutaminase-like and TPR domain